MLYASKKKGYEGDLVAFIPTESGKLICIIDKKNPLYKKAFPEQTWIVEIEHHPKSTYVIGQLVSECRVHCERKNTSADYPFPIGVEVTNDEGEVLLVIPIAQHEINKTLKQLYRFYISNAGLNAYMGKIMEFTVETHNWVHQKFTEIEETVKEAMFALQGSMPDLSQVKFPVKRIGHMEVEGLIYKIMDPFQTPSLELILDHITSLGIGHDEDTDKWYAISFKHTLADEKERSSSTPST